MAQQDNLAPSEVNAATGFHRNNARWHLTEELQHLRSPQFVAQKRMACAVRPVNLKHILRQTGSDHDNL